MSPVLLRWVLVALLLPALGAPRGVAWAWCLCVEALCGCCEAPAELAETDCCAPAQKAEDRGSRDELLEPPEECGACGQWQVDVEGLEALVPPIEQDHGPLLAAWALELAPADLQLLPLIARERARGPPRMPPQTGLRPGALPLRI